VKPGAEIIKFPQRVPIRRVAASRSEPAIIIVLPVVRIETYEDGAPLLSRCGRRRRRKPGDAA
jgi:hypothetical protein